MVGPLLSAAVSPNRESAIESETGRFIEPATLPLGDNL
jgi:hypothetical protein